MTLLLLLKRNSAVLVCALTSQNKANADHSSLTGKKGHSFGTLRQDILAQYIIVSPVQDRALCYVLKKPQQVRKQSFAASLNSIHINFEALLGTRVGQTLNMLRITMPVMWIYHFLATERCPKPRFNHA